MIEGKTIVDGESSTVQSCRQDEQARASSSISRRCLEPALPSISGAQRSIVSVVDISEGAYCRGLCATAFVHGAQPSIVVESRSQASIK